MGLCSHALLVVLTFCVLIASGFIVGIRAYKADIDDEIVSVKSYVYRTAGNSTSGPKRSLKSPLGNMFHANSTLLPKECDENCVGRIRSRRIDRHLRARMNKRRKLENAILSRISNLWLDGQKISEWYVTIAVTDTLDDNVQTIHVVPDTASFLTWVQCKPCNHCYPQRWKLYNPVISQRYNALERNAAFCQKVQSTAVKWPNPQPSGDPCKYRALYGDGTISFGVVSTETFRFKNFDQSEFVITHNIGFGCGYKNRQGTNTGMSGLLGLSRAGGVSIPEQVSNIMGSSYGFCLPIPGSSADAGFFVIGNDAVPEPGTEEGFQSINFPTGGKPGYFYLDAVDMMLDGRGVGIPEDSFNFNADRTGGLLMDTGTMISDFKPAAYNIFRDAYRRFMRPLLGDKPVFNGKHRMDTCYDVTGIDLEKLQLPTMGLVLRNGLHFEFGRIATYFTYYSKTGRPLLCLPMIPFDDSYNKWSILGAYQMMEIDMNFDVPNNRFVWKGNSC